MKNWFIPIDNKAFNIEEKFNNPCSDEVAFIDQHQLPRCKLAAGDIAYIYCTKEQAIKYRCLVSKINIPLEKTYDDSKYIANKKFFEERRSYQNHMRLLLINKMNIPIKTIKENDYNFFTAQNEIKGKFKKYLDNLPLNSSDE